ncbi:MAG: mannose-1-phosphate guanylyltransferase/mannose-6-phosphate isomerase, partial [Pseudomonadota bacterium]|nr:mannose-1-phosphate guanylyltransferase/mannose-6-phosphate isomerase [Pseudomonadota bacterium]MEC8664753.1 mannose-1-phosphate guanylyltransferase/mannose-6-phosphate isomerase [Pseudomonadota bacterium]
TFLNALYELQPDIHAHSYQAVASASRIQNAIMLEQNAFAECRSISVDYAVMEHAPNKVVMPVDMKWCDMGTWPSLLSALLKA